ncbi:MAG: SUMF1/EgtB/PvdO family nonheme iron enzyme [Pirellulales bacterium]
MPNLVSASQTPRELSVELRSILSRASYYDRAVSIGDSPAVAELEKKFSGRLFENGGWLERVPLDQVEACVTAMKQQKFVPSSLRPYQIKGAWYSAITWKPGNGPVELGLDLADNKLQEEFEAKQAKGFALVDFCRYGDKQHWLAVWQLDPEQSSKQVLRLNQTVENRLIDEKGLVMLRYQQRTNRDDEPTYDVLWGVPEDLSGIPQGDVRNIFWSRIEYAAGDLYPGHFQSDLRFTNTYAELDRSTAWGDLMDATNKISQAGYLCRLGNFDDAHNLLLDVDEEQFKSTSTNRRTYFRLKARIFWSLGMLAELEELVEQNSSFLDRDIEYMKIAVAVLKSDLTAVTQHLQSIDSASFTSSTDRMFCLRLLGFVASQSEMPEQSALALKLLFKNAESWFRDSAFQQDVLLDAEFDELRGQPEWDKFVQRFELVRRFSSSHYIQFVHESKQVLTLSPSAHSQRANELLAEGYLPTIWIVDDETRDVSSVWSRRIRSTFEDTASSDRIAQVIFALGKLGEIDAFVDGLNGKWGRTVQTSLMGNSKEILSAATLVNILKSATSSQLQTTLLSALATFKPTDFEDSDLKYLRLRLNEWITDGKEISLLNMARFCAEKLGEKSPDLPRQLELAESRNWFTNTLGQQFAVINPPAECQIGPKSDLRRQTVRIGRAYAIASTEVTGEQFQEFFSDPRYQAWVAENTRLRGTAVLVPGSLPQSHISWFVAIQFCQWLNEKEQVPEDQWCYKNVWGEKGEYPIPNSNYLSRTGYRLPTLAEWCWAAGAGNTHDRWHFGNSPKWSGLYGWTVENANRSLHPVGKLRPNGLGLFDTCGNVIEWIDNFDRRPSRPPFDSAVADVGNSQANDGSSTNGSVYLLEMGGHFKASVQYAEVSKISMDTAIHASSSTGFRLARTIKSR